MVTSSRNSSSLRNNLPSPIVKEVGNHSASETNFMAQQEQFIPAKSSVSRFALVFIAIGALIAQAVFGISKMLQWKNLGHSQIEGSLATFLKSSTNLQMWSHRPTVFLSLINAGLNQNAIFTLIEQGVTALPLLRMMVVLNPAFGMAQIPQVTVPRFLNMD